MDLPDEILTRIYNFLDSKSLKHLMETCRRNYDIVNSNVPPTYYLNGKNFLKYFNTKKKSLKPRNFKNLKVQIALDTLATFTRFFRINGNSIRNLTAILDCCSCQCCLSFFKSLPSINKLHVSIIEPKYDPYFQNLENNMQTLSELTINAIDLIFCVDLKLFIQSQIKKFTFKNGFVQLSATDEEILNSKWNLSKLTMECFTVLNNFQEIVELIKLQKDLKFVHFRLRNRQKSLKGLAYDELVEFFLKTASLNTLLCTVPRKWKYFFTARLKNSSIEYLELRSFTFSREQQLSIEKCFTHPKIRIVFDRSFKDFGF